MRATNPTMSSQYTTSTASLLVRASAVRLAAFVGLALVILFARRPDQFLHPYIWVEDGVYTLPGYIERGWLELFQPLAGYLVVISKLMNVAALQLAPLYAPPVLAAFAIAFIVTVALAVALSPTHLRMPILCSFAILLVPTDPEVFAIAEYAFWWAGLLLPLALVWREERQWQRWLYLVVGGLSSPLIVPIAALLALRLVLERSRREALATALAAAVAGVQILAMRNQAASGIVTAASWPDLRSIPLIAQKYVGGLFHADVLLAGLTIVAALTLLAWTGRKHLDRYFVLITLTFLAIAITISARLPSGALANIDPFTGPPRYFFYPFILLSWIVIWLASVSPRPAQAVIATGFAVSLALAGSRLSRRHDAVHWRTHMLACASSDSYDLPIHYIGRAAEMWHVKLTGAQCRDLLSRSLF